MKQVKSNKSRIFVSEPEESQRLYCDQWVKVTLREKKTQQISSSEGRQNVQTNKSVHKNNAR